MKNKHKTNFLGQSLYSHLLPELIAKCQNKKSTFSCQSQPHSLSICLQELLTYSGQREPYAHCVTIQITHNHTWQFWSLHSESDTASLKQERQMEEVDEVNRPKKENRGGGRSSIKKNSAQTSWGIMQWDNKIMQYEQLWVSHSNTCNSKGGWRVLFKVMQPLINS